jgi:hypothetical protein
MQVQKQFDPIVKAFSGAKAHHLFVSRPVGAGAAGGVPWHPQILSDQLTLSQPGGADYAHHFTTGTPGFSDLPTALVREQRHRSYTLVQNATLHMYIV